MGRRNEHSREEIREMALAAAGRIVEAEGLAGLTARKLASTIGYTVGTLYLVFRNLDDLLFQLNGRTLDRLHAELQQAVIGCMGATVCVTALAHGYVRFAHESPRLWGALYDFAPSADEPLPAWYREKVDRLLGLVEHALLPLHGERSAAEIATAARVLWGGVHGICVLKLTHRMEIAGNEPAEALIESLIDHYLAGLSGRDEVTRRPTALRGKGQ